MLTESGPVSKSFISREGQSAEGETSLKAETMIPELDRKNVFLFQRSNRKKAVFSHFKCNN